MDRVIDLSSYTNFKPDVGELARRRLASVRHRLGLSPDTFAASLNGMMDWNVTGDAVEEWESRAVPPGDVLVAADLLAQSGGGDGQADSLGTAGADALEQLISERFADLASVFPSRSAFSATLPPHVLFDTAKDIAIVGLSLNLVCQQYADKRLTQLIEGGSAMRCLFLLPYGESIQVREREEDYPTGHLSALTEMNIRILARLRARLSPAAEQRLILATYDEPVRFNIVLVDDQVCVVQPYLPGIRGVDSPTFLLRRLASGEGLFPIFQHVFSALWERSTPA